MDVNVLAVVALAIGFAFLNGAHDAANSIATLVSTRRLAPRKAVLWAAAFNMAAVFFFGDQVAATIANDVVQQDVLSIGVVFAGLAGALAWDVLTYWLGLPTSSTHALVGGMAGAAVAAAGTGVLVREGLRLIGVFIVLSPLIGLALGLALTVGISWVFRRTRNVADLNRGFGTGQLVCSAAYSLGHGANDAQKTMGVILAVLVTTGEVRAGASSPLWVALAAHAALAVGTLFGGWRIVRTMGSRITRIQPVDGAAAQSAAAITLIGTSAAGIPVSTTQTITGAIVGAGSARRLSAVRWGVARQVVWAWVLTIPVAFGVSWSVYRVVEAVA